MRFERLKASIANNAAEEPSIYMAVCMVESLFSDIEDTSGMDIDACPVGDDTLPIKLSWLCKTLRKIYTKNDEELQRGRARLDKLMADIADTERELDALQDVAGTLQTQRARMTELQTDLEHAAAKQRECERLQAEIARAEASIAEAEKFDADAARAELEDLKRREDALILEKTELEAALETGRERKQTLESEMERAAADKQACEQLHTQIQEMEAKLFELRAFDPNAAREKLRSLTEETEQLSQEKESLDASLAEKTDRLKTLVLERDAAQALVIIRQEEAEQCDQDIAAAKESSNTFAEQISQAKETLREVLENADKQKKERDNLANEIKEKNDARLLYQEEQIEPLRAEKQQLEQQEEQDRQTCANLTNEIDDLQQQKADRAVQISEFRTKVETLKNELKEKNAQYDTLLRKRGEFQQGVQDQTDALSRLQDEVSKLEEQQLPQIERLLTEEQKRREDLEEKLTRQQGELDELREKTREREQTLPSLNEDLTRARTRYSELTATVTASTKELEDLEREIDQLQSQTDSEKLETYRSQRLDKIKKLEEMKEECDALENKNRELDRQVEEQTKAQQRLSDIQEKRKHDLEREQTHLRELQAVVTPEYLEKASELANRVASLSASRQNLERTLQSIRRYLSIQPNQADADLENQIKLGLQKMTEFTAALKAELIKCASNVKLEEK